MNRLESRWNMEECSMELKFTHSINLNFDVIIRSSGGLVPTSHSHQTIT